VFWRAFLENGKTEPGVTLMEQTRIYPLARADDPPAMSFPNASGVPLDMLFPRDGTYYGQLAGFFAREPAAPEDFALRGMAARLGIVKGQPFQPDARMTRLLDRAAQTGFKMASNVAYTDEPSIHLFPDRMWRRGFHGDSPVFKTDTYLDFDAMIAFFHSAYSTSPAMVIQMPGKGAQYLGGITDADTRSLLDNGQPFPSIASNSNLEPNPDGSADLFFGPEPPQDGNPNWIKTVPGRGWLAALRLYSPTQAFFDQAWKPGNIEKTQ
jgi:hypothetical protein